MRNLINLQLGRANHISSLITPQPYQKKKKISSTACSNKIQILRLESTLCSDTFDTTGSISYFRCFFSGRLVSACGRVPCIHLGCGGRDQINLFFSGTWLFFLLNTCRPRINRNRGIEEAKEVCRKHTIMQCPY